MKTRQRTITALRQEIAALDLANKHKDHQLEALWRTVITLRLTVGLPLTLLEEHWLNNQPQPEQDAIKRTAATCNKSLKHGVIVTTTSATPIKQTATVTKPATRAAKKRQRMKNAQPAKKKRQRVETDSAGQRWTESETKLLHRYRTEHKSWDMIGNLLDRSPHACEQQYHKTKKKK